MALHEAEPVSDNKIIAEKSIKQSEANRRELFRRLDLLTLFGNTTYIDPEKLYEFLIAHNFDQEQPTDN